MREVDDFQDGDKCKSWKRRVIMFTTYEKSTVAET